MSDLTKARDWARRMQNEHHRSDCPVKIQVAVTTKGYGQLCANPLAHDFHLFEERGMTWMCPGVCGGCIPAADRALWRRHADEIDAHLAREGDEDEEAML